MRCEQGRAKVVEQRQGGRLYRVGVRVFRGHVRDQQRRLQVVLDRPLCHPRLVDWPAHHGDNAAEISGEERTRSTIVAGGGVARWLRS